MQEPFTDRPELYLDSPSFTRLSDLELAGEALPDVEGLSVLDVGVGAGHSSFYFARKQAHLFGVEPDPDMLALAQEESDRLSLGCRFLPGSGEAMPFDDETFDLVVCRMAAHHIGDLDAFFSEAGRVLKGQGHLLVIDNLAETDPQTFQEWLFSFEKARDPRHRHTLTALEWRELFGSNGFAVQFEAVCPYRLDFEEWCARQSVSQERAEELWDSLQTSDVAKSHLKPEVELEGRRTFTFSRGIFVAGKS